MKIALVQGKIYWENPRANLDYYDKLISQVSDHSRVIVLPEAFTTGFTMNINKLSDIISYPVLDWMVEKAYEINKTIVGSVFVKENGHFYNRLYWVNSDGSYQYYDKRHLFGLAGENKIFTPGTRRVVVQQDGLNFNLQICYDLRFPVWSANKYDKKSRTFDYDVLIYVANWPAVRKNAYLPLLRARAIENQAFVIWVNRIGRDAYMNTYSGDTRIIHPGGKVLATVKSSNEGILEYDLSLKELEAYRKKFLFGPDMDDFEVKI